MHKVHVSLKKEEDRSYNIIIENGLFAKIPELLKTNPVGKKYAVISDNNVSALYGEKLVQSLKDAGIEAKLLTFKDGDENKNMQTVEYLLNNMIGHGFDRKGAVIALGGGVTGDIAGFTASIYLRGIPFIQIPTTLLAMADSSVGGKTGTNLKAGKNLVGTFYQPKAVYIDPTLLSTLPRIEFLNGMSEVLKYGIIHDKDFFELIESNKNNLNYDTTLNEDKKAAPLNILNKLIVRSCEIKTEIVQKDERESGIRKILNYGHTIGHAIETISNYKVSHGQAIALGMKLINNICSTKEVLKNSYAERINNLITDLNLVHTETESFATKENADKLWTIMLNDKKVSSGKITFIIPTQIGKVIQSTDITLEDFRTCLK